MSKAAKAKKSMRCGQVKKSYKPEKKIMQKVCKDGVEKIIHAGSSAYTSNSTPAQRANFRKRHNCATAKAGTPRKLACDHLWSASSPSIRGKSAAKRRLAKTGNKK